MYNLFGSENKTKILVYLANNPHKKAKEIAKETNINYKFAFKILQEFLELGILVKKRNEYYIKSQFIEYIRKLSKTLLINYTNSIFLKNKLDLYNTFISLYPNEDIREDIDNLIDTWLLTKLDDWYCKYYDLENEEYLRIKKIILENKKNNKIEILEVGCGTGRLSKKLAKDFNKITGIDKEKKFIDFCEKQNFSSNLRFETKDFLDMKKTDTKFDVIIFSWIGLHYQEKLEEFLNIISEISKKNSIIIILDAYYETEYIKILQMIRPFNIDSIKLLKDNLNERIIKKFGSVKQEILFTKYNFPNISEVINNFKIELTLEESHIWTKDDEALLKDFLLKKKKPLEISEGLWITTTNINSTN